MSSDQAPRAARRLAGRLRARLWAARWQFGASLAGLALAALAGIWGLLAGTVLVLAAWVLAPGPRSWDGDPAIAPAGVSATDDLLGGLTVVELAAAVPDALVILDRHGQIVLSNPAAETAFGPLPEGLLLRVRFRSPEMQTLIDRLLARQKADLIDYVERGPVERAYRVAGVALASEGLVVLVFRDQSEARRIDRMRADFIANASHELRTPLASITGFIETLQGPARGDEKARDRFLAIMQSQTQRMARLIDDLLSLSRLEMRTYVRPTTPVDLIPLLRQIVEALGHLARESGVAIQPVLPDGPVEVPGNRDELIQVFQNLVENAIKYGADGARVEVVLVDNRTGPDKEVAVSIRDYGPGIAEEHIPRITERFYRVDGEGSRASKGTGLGLAIVKHILTRHDGRLTIASRPGEGATFTVHLPAALR